MAKAVSRFILGFSIYSFGNSVAAILFILALGSAAAGHWIAAGSLFAFAVLMLILRDRFDPSRRRDDD